MFQDCQSKPHKAQIERETIVRKTQKMLQDCQSKPHNLSLVKAQIERETEVRNTKRCYKTVRVNHTILV